MAWTDYVEEVQKLYIAYYQRPADPEGLRYWAERLDAAGGSLNGIVEAFANSEESQRLYGEINEENIADVVTAIYRAAFNRDPEEGGLNYYVTGFVNEQFTAATIMLDILNGAQGSDAVVLEHKLISAMNFTEALDPTHDVNDEDFGTDGTTATYDANDEQAGREFLADVGVLPSSIKTDEDAVQYIKDHIADPGDPILTPPGEVTTELTPEEDHVVGTAGDDVIVGTDRTLTAGDQIDGGAHVEGDKLKVSSSVDHNFSAFEVQNVEQLEVTSDNRADISFDLSGWVNPEDPTQSSLQLVKTLNSTGDVILDHVPALADVEVNNMTATAPITQAVHYQDRLVGGDDTTVNLHMVNNINAAAGTIQIGSDADPNGGIEVINITTSGGASHIAALDSDVVTLNISGNSDLTIDNPLNPTVDTVDASGLNADLEIHLEGNVGTSADHLTVITGGNDVVTLNGVNRNAQVSTGQGDDAVVAGMGDDTYDLGEGDDVITFAPNGITVADSITGGAGNDKIDLSDGDTLELSELEHVTDIEEIEIHGIVNDSYLTFPDATINSITGSDRLLVDVTDSFTDTVIDITNITSLTTHKFELQAERDINDGIGTDNIGSTKEVVIADDTTINSGAILDFGAGIEDKLRVVDGATITADDLVNIHGLEVMRLETKSNTPQTWNIQVRDALVRQMTQNDADASDGFAQPPAGNEVPFVINIDNDVPAGSVVNIDADGLTLPVIVNANANVTVNVTGSGAGNVAVQNSLYFTSNADNLVGTANDDVFYAESLSHLQAADHADGLGHVNGDELVAEFAVNNLGLTLDQLFNQADINNIEILRFATVDQSGDPPVDDPVAFLADDNATLSLRSIYDFNTIITGTNDDHIRFGTWMNSGSRTVTVHSLDGDDTVDVTDPTVGFNVDFDAGAGDDTMNLDDSAPGSDTVENIVASSNFDPGDGVDTLNIEELDDGAGGDSDIQLNAGWLANFINSPSDHTLENLEIVAEDNLEVQFNNADMQELSSHIEVESDSNLGGVGDLYVDFSAVTDPALGVDYLEVDANGRPGLVVGSAGDDEIHIVSGDFGGAATALTTDASGIVGERGADKIYLEADGLQDNVVYKTPQDGALEGQNTGFDEIYNFEHGADKIIFALNGGAYAVESGAGSIGTTLDKDAGGAGDVDAVINPATINLNVDEVAVFDTTGLTDAEIRDVNALAGFLAANTSLTNDTTGDILLFVVQGTNDTALVWFTSENQDGDVQANEISILGVVDNTHIYDTTTGVLDIDYA